MENPYHAQNGDGIDIENIHIHHCFVGQSHGGFVIGSEMSRGVCNVLVKDCTCVAAKQGIRIKGLDNRMPTISKITFENCSIDAKMENLFEFCSDITIK